MSSGSYLIFLKKPSGVSFSNPCESLTFLYLNSRKLLKSFVGENLPVSACSSLKRFIVSKVSGAKSFIFSTPVN